MNKILIRLPLIIGSGWLSFALARWLIILPPHASPLDYRFSGSFLIALSAALAIFDIYLKNADAALSAIKVDETLTAKEKKQLTKQVVRSKFALNLTTAFSLCFKILSGLCGTLLVTGTLASAHFSLVFDIGFGLLGAGIPLILFVYVSSRDLQAVSIDLVHRAEEFRERSAQIKTLRASPSHDFSNDETLKKFGKIVKPSH